MKKFICTFMVGGLFLIMPIGVYAFDQYATSVVGFSTQFTTANWSAKQALGAPNTLTYGDISTAWVASTQDAGPEFLSLGYTTPVYATGVTIRETDNPGIVTQIEVIDTANITHSVWTGTDAPTPGIIKNFVISWPKTTFLVKTVIVHMDTSLVAGWNEIDSVQLHGTPTLAGTLTERFGHSATLLCKNMTTAQTITTTIIGKTATAPVSAWDCEKAGLKVKMGDNVNVQISGTINN